MSPRRPPKRRRLPNLPTFSSFARAVSNSKSPIKPGFGSENPNPDPKPVKEVESYSSEEEEEEEEVAEEVQADFGFFDPKPGDFNGVKLLVQNYLDDWVWDVSGFVDLMLEQTTVGSVIKLDSEDDDDGDNGNDDEGLYGVISALNLGRYSGHRCISELKEFLLKSCSNEVTKKKMKSMLEEQASDVGLLVSQRFVNCPHQLVPPLYDALFDEVSWATEDEPTQEFRDSFRFKYYLLVTRIYENKTVNHHKARLKQDADEPVIYKKAEDEIFRELSTLAFTFRLHAEQLVPQELKNYKEMGLVMVVKAQEVPKFREKLKALLAES